MSLATSRIAGGLGVLIAGAALLRSGALGIGYWTDEGIAVGIASLPPSDIPSTLRLDGSPPLYYLLLHGWIQLFGAAESATRSLSLVFALGAVPVAFWAGRRLLGARGSWLAAGLTASIPYLTVYGQEARMYALMVLLSLVAVTAFVLAAVRAERRHLLTLTAALVAMLYTHNWALFFGAALAGAWWALWRRGEASGRDGLLVFGVVAALYAPWLPTLVDQALHTGAPWSGQPSPLRLLKLPFAIFGAVATPLLAVACVAALRDRTAPRDLIGLLLAIAGATAALAWLSSQVAPGWAVRYFAVLVGPLLLAVAAALTRGGRVARVAVAAMAAGCVLFPIPVSKSNARAVTDRLGAALGPGDVVISSAPEQVPVLAHYLRAGVRYVLPSGPVADPKVADWRDVVERLRDAPARAVYDRAVAGLAPGGRLLVVTTIVHPPADRNAPLLRVSRARGRQLDAWAASDPRLRLVTTERPPVSLDVRAQIAAGLYERIAP